MRSIKRKVKSGFKKIGKNLVKDKPRDSFETIQIALSYVLTQRPTCNLVQVGACDGSSHDPIYRILKKNKVHATLVEPIPTNFNALMQTYYGLNNIHFIKAAVSDENGERLLYSVADRGRWAGNAWAKGWATFDRKKLLQQGVKSSEIIEQTIPTVTLQNIISKHGGQIDVLVVDTEGFDDEIVKMALRLISTPSIIYFEHVHVSSKRLYALADLLDEAGYKWAYGSMNVLCIHESVWHEW